MSEQLTNGAEKEVALESIITSAIQIPGVKVDRKKFLAEMFATEDVVIQDVLDLGPIAANIPQDRLTVLANKHILKRTSESSVASFVAGIPGGFAMAATIPLDVLQFLEWHCDLHKNSRICTVRVICGKTVRWMMKRLKTSSCYIAV